MEEKLRKTTMSRKAEVDEEHMLICGDNPEERTRAASQLVAGTVDEAQSEQQMALTVWKCWGGGGMWKAKTRLIITSLYHMAHQPSLPSPPVPLTSCLITVLYSPSTASQLRPALYH